MPFYLLPSLGGNNTLRSYPDYRFHDLNAAVLNAESRWALFTHVDVALFVDAGNVAPQFQDLNFDKRSYGGGIRFHTDRATFARIDVAQGAEGWRVVFRTSDPVRIARLTRRVAAVPFVPERQVVIRACLFVSAWLAVASLQTTTPVPAPWMRQPILLSDASTVRGRRARA